MCPRCTFIILKIRYQVQSTVLDQHQKYSEVVEHLYYFQIYHVSVGYHHHKKSSHHQEYKVGVPKGIIRFYHSGIKYYPGLF